MLRTLADRMSAIQQIDDPALLQFPGTMRSSISLPVLLLFACTCFPQSPEFLEPWKKPHIALAIDPYEGNDIDWDKLATDKRVVAIIHRATTAIASIANTSNVATKRSSADTNGVLIISRSLAIRSSKLIFPEHG